MSDKTLIFLHIPKTAGTTLRSIMLKQYGDGEVYHIVKNSTGGDHGITSIDSFKSFDDEVKKKYRAITGHVKYGIHKILPAGQEYAYATILREPVKRVLSLYNRFVVKGEFKDNGKDPGIEDFFIKYRLPQFDNDQVRRLSGMEAPFGQCTEEMLEQAMRNLKGFSLVGLTEAFLETLFLAAKVLGWKPVAYKNENVRRYSPAIDENIMELIKRHNGLDIRLYEYARNLFRERLEGTGPDWESRLKEFKEALTMKERTIRTRKKKRGFKRLFRRVIQWRKARGVSRDPVICFQMGKVGSMTVFHSLKTAFDELALDVPIHHVHRLNNLEKREEDVRKKRKNPEATLGHLMLCKALRKTINENPGQRWNIISMVRDPVSRNVAAFFHNLHEFVPDWLERYSCGDLDTEKLVGMFLEFHGHDAVENWFDEQMKMVFGIDVFAAPFTKEKGYNIYREQGRNPLLVIRLENLNYCAALAMREFLGIKNFALVNTNIGEDKKYSEPYKAFKKNARLPLEYVRRICDTKVARHFYTDEELEAFAGRWSNPK